MQATHTLAETDSLTGSPEAYETKILLFARDDLPYEM